MKIVDPFVFISNCWQSLAGNQTEFALLRAWRRQFLESRDELVIALISLEKPEKKR